MTAVSSWLDAKGVHQEAARRWRGMAAVKNYITPGGLQRLKDECDFCSPGASGGDQGRRVGGGQRRSQRERRLSVQQAAAAPDRSADPISHEAHRCRGSRGPGSAENGPGGDAGVLRSDRALRNAAGASGSCSIVGSTKSIWIATTSAGCRRWRAR